MASAVQSLLVFGQVYFLNPVPNTPLIGTDLDSANSTVYPDIDRRINDDELPRNISRNDYTYTPGIGAYKVHTKAAPWNSCRKTCLEEGGYLAIINSVAEAKHVAKLGKDSGPQTGSEWKEYFHIGIHNLYHNEEWVTIHSESLVKAGYDEWDAGQPDRHEPSCGCINSATAKFDDSMCRTPLAFICEWPTAMN